MVVVQRVLEDRVPKLLEKLLLKPSLVSPPAMEEGGLILLSNMTRNFLLFAQSLREKHEPLIYPLLFIFVHSVSQIASRGI